MRRIGELFQSIVSFENLFLASRKARKGKRFKRGVLAFEADIEEELQTLRDELVSKTYKPGGYTEFVIYERKPRKISAAPYRDRMVHHALCNIIEPLFERAFIYDSYACRKGKGTHRAVYRFNEFCRKNKYVLKTDIKRYFPSIDHEILFAKIARKIKCRDTLWLIRLIIDGSNRQEEINDYFPDDNLFTPCDRRRGIPIGNLTSQFFANVYLDGLDHYIKERLHCKYYMRYVDDITVFGDEKSSLWAIKGDMARYLDYIRLRLHTKKTYVMPVSEGIDHIGYRIFPSYRLLRKDTSIEAGRRIRFLFKRFLEKSISFEELNTSVQSWLGHARHADTFGLRRDVLRS